MAATQKGVWDLQEVRDKQLASEWPYLGGPSERTALYTWGNNDEGKGGHDTNQGGVTAYSSPTQVPGTWKHVALGTGQTYGIKSDGTYWAWGQDSDNGELGQNETPGASRSSPTQVGTNTNWGITVSASHAVIASKTDGTLWAWGDNEHGMLAQNEGGTGSGLDCKSSPTQIGTDTTWSSDVKHQTAGYRTLLAIKTNGTLWGWGFHGYGSLGLNEAWGTGSRSSPTQVGTQTTWNCVDTGSNTTYGTKTDGTLWSFGYGTDGGLGLNNAGGPASRSSPTQIGTDTDWSITRAAIYVGYGLKTDGTLWAWGRNEHGQLAQSDRTKRSSPTQIPGTWFWVESADYYAYGQKTDGTLWSWGRNENGQSGQNSTSAARYSSPVQIPGYWNIKAVALSGGNGANSAAGMKMP